MSCRRAEAAALLTALCLAACSERVDVVARAHGSATVADAGAPVADAGAPPACEYGGAISRSGGRALEELGADVRAHALCTCTGFASSSALRVRAAEGAPAGIVGVDGAMALSAPTIVDGALHVAGAEGLTLGDAELEVGGSLAVGGDVLGAEARVMVGGDLEAAGRIQLAELEVGGVLTQPDGAGFDVPSGGPASRTVADVRVAPRCRCDDDARIDPAALAALPWGEDASIEQACELALLPAGDGEPRELFFEHGGALRVEGDMAIDGALTLGVAAGQSLDLFVDGNVRVDGPLTLGGAGGRVNLHVGGSGTLQLSAGGRIDGLLHAPDAELVLAGAPLEINGHALLRRVGAQAELIIVAPAP